MVWSGGVYGLQNAPWQVIECITVVVRKIKHCDSGGKRHLVLTDWVRMLKSFHAFTELGQYADQTGRHGDLKPGVELRSTGCTVALYVRVLPTRVLAQTDHCFKKKEEKKLEWVQSDIECEISKLLLNGLGPWLNCHLFELEVGWFSGLWKCRYECGLSLKLLWGLDPNSYRETNCKKAVLSHNYN